MVFVWEFTRRIEVDRRLQVWISRLGRCAMGFAALYPSSGLTTKSVAETPAFDRRPEAGEQLRRMLQGRTHELNAVTQNTARQSSNATEGPHANQTPNILGFSFSSLQRLRSKRR